MYYILLSLCEIHLGIQTPYLKLKIILQEVNLMNSILKILSIQKQYEAELKMDEAI
jgi:hypothetical protein